MSADSMDSSRFGLTQEYLAQMPSVRRASVNAVAPALSEEGTITYTRGTITVRDRGQLFANACSCYAAVSAAAGRALEG